MFDTRETVKALVRVFNVNNRFSDTVETNFTLETMYEKDYLIVSFDKDMDRYQCCRYLNSIKRKVIREFYGIEESNNEEILDTAELIFDIKSFPFDISKGELSGDKQHGFKFAIRVDEGVIFNLKSHLAFSLKKDVQEDMLIYITSKTFDKKKYLWYGEFPNKESCQQFEHWFLSRMNERYENVPDNLLKVEGNDVYIRNVFDDPRFIDSITQRNALLIGRSLQANSKNRSDVKAFKDLIVEFINQSTGLIVVGFMCASPLSGKGASILIPVILDSEGFRALTNEEALSINDAFYGIAFSDVDGKTCGELPVNGSSGIYGIDFYNPQVSYCVVTKIIESSVINKDHRLTIGPELFARSWSRSPSTDISDTELESPRQSEKETGVLYANVGSGNLPQQSTGAAAVGANESVQEADISLQQKDPWLSQGTHEDKWLQSLQPGSSGLSQQRPSLWPQVISSVPLSLEGAQASANKRGISEEEKELIKDEKAMSNPSEKQGKSNAVGADESVQGAFGGFPSPGESSDKYEEDRAKSESPKRHGVFCQLKGLFSNKSNEPNKNFERDVRHSSTQSAPVHSVSEKPPVSKQRSFPGRRKARSNLPSEVSSPAHPKNTSWQLPEVIVKSAPPAEGKSQQLGPKASVSRNGSNRSNDSGVESLGPSPLSSSYEGSPDTSGRIGKQLPSIPFSQTQSTGPSGFSAMQDTGARKKVTGESDICSANPWAVPSTAAFVPISVSHEKSNIDKLGEDFSRAIKVTEEGKLGSSELEYGHQWLDRERYRRSTKQVTKEELASLGLEIV